MGFKQTYRFFILICLVLSVGFLVFYFNEKTDNPTLEDEFKKQYNVEFSLAETVQDHQYKSDIDLEWMFKERHSNYESNIKSLHNTLLNVVIINVLGILLIFYKPKGINVSFLSIQIPETLLYLVVILGSLYLWSNLGLLLNSAIDSRLTLDYQLQALTSNFHDLNYQNELSHILVDNSIVDNWCGHFFGVFREGGDSLFVLNRIGLFGIFGLLTALLFAVINITAIELGYRKQILQGLSAFLVTFSMLLIVTSCVVWVSDHTYSAYYIAYVWLMTAVFTFLWKRFRNETVSNFSSE